jgi:hypothetical protein
VGRAPMRLAAREGGRCVTRCGKTRATDFLTELQSSWILRRPRPRLQHVAVCRLPGRPAGRSARCAEGVPARGSSPHSSQHPQPHIYIELTISHSKRPHPRVVPRHVLRTLYLRACCALVLQSSSSDASAFAALKVRSKVAGRQEVLPSRPRPWQSSVPSTHAARSQRMASPRPRRPHQATELPHPPPGTPAGGATPWKLGAATMAGPDESGGI